MNFSCPGCGGRHRLSAERVKCMADDVRKRRIERIRVTHDGVERERTDVNDDEQAEGDE